jgi:hypothetical protein
MHLKKDVQEDIVLVRWIRTAGATTTAAAVVMGAIWWVVAPRVVEWGEGVARNATAELREEQKRTADHLDRLDQVVVSLEAAVAKIGDAAEQSTAPSWRWDPVETSIGDGPIGGWVDINAAGYKLRECGIPRVDLYFINGGGTYHRFGDTSLLTPDNRGVAFPVNPARLQTIKYRARIPTDDGVTPGRAQGYISITYPDACPAVSEQVIGPLQFRIREGA